MAEYKGAAKEGARAMALMKKREKMKADIEAAKNKISEVSFSFCAFGIFFVNLAMMIMKLIELFVRSKVNSLEKLKVPHKLKVFPLITFRSHRI